LDDAEARLRSQVAGQSDLVLSLLAEHDVNDVTDPTEAPVALASHIAHAESELKQIRADRKRAKVLDKQIISYQETVNVATMSGDLLKANAFERWLCGEALDSLVAEASEMLSELSVTNTSSTGQTATN
jgi:exonuclease SbcC